MAHTKGLPIKQLDKRVVDRYLRRGVLADKDYKAHLKDLPDLEGHYDAVSLPEESTKPDAGDVA